MALKIKRRNTGSAGAPSSLLSGQLAINKMDGILYCGVGDDGAGNATSIIAVGGAAYVLASLINAASGVAPLDAGGRLPKANLPVASDIKSVLALAVADVSGAAPLASPAFTGNPTGPTAAAANNSTQLATTAYADRAAATAANTDDGTF